MATDHKRVSRENANGPAVLSFRPIQDGLTSVLALYRKPGREPFSKAEADLTHITLSEIPWLHEQGWPGNVSQKVPQLSRQLRLTLNLLLEGLSRDEIATNMSLSRHTVGDYLKALYQYFQVSSQTELIAKFATTTSR